MSYPIDLKLRPSELMFGLFNYHNNHKFDGADVSFSDAKASNKVEYPDRVTVHSNVEIAGVDVPRAVVHYTRIDISRLFSVCKLELLDKWLTPTIDFDKIKEAVLYRYGVNIEDGFTVHALTNRSGGFALTAALSNVAYKGTVDIKIVRSLDTTRVKVKALNGLRHLPASPVTLTPLDYTVSVSDNYVFKRVSIAENVEATWAVGKKDENYLLSLQACDATTGKTIRYYRSPEDYQYTRHLVFDTVLPYSPMLRYTIHGRHLKYGPSSTTIVGVFFVEEGFRGGSYTERATPVDLRYPHTLYCAGQGTHHTQHYTLDFLNGGKVNKTHLYNAVNRLHGSNFIIDTDGDIYDIGTNLGDVGGVPTFKKVLSIPEFTGNLDQQILSLGEDDEHYYVSTQKILTGPAPTIYRVNKDMSGWSSQVASEAFMSLLVNVKEIQTTHNCVYISYKDAVNKWKAFSYTAK